MTELFEYESFEEKLEFFDEGDSRVLNDINNVLAKLEQLSKIGGVIFRGSPEAKYKMYNSAQRYYVQNDLYKSIVIPEIVKHFHAFVSELIEECKSWNNNTVSNLLKTNNISEENSLAYLSYMQHYGVPSPFLDFTFSPYIALFFAIDSMSYKPSDRLLDNYFSIYHAHKDAIAFQGWRQMFTKFNEENLNGGILPYEELAKSSLHILLPDNKAYQILNNTNIINQQGLFFYNAHPSLPLEEHYKRFIPKIIADIGEQGLKDQGIQKKFSLCINIHKSLIPYLLHVLKLKGITKEFLFPDNYQMKNIVIHNAMKKILSRKK